MLSSVPDCPTEKAAASKAAPMAPDCVPIRDTTKSHLFRNEGGAGAPSSPERI